MPLIQLSYLCYAIIQLLVNFSSGSQDDDTQRHGPSSLSNHAPEVERLVVTNRMDNMQCLNCGIPKLILSAWLMLPGKNDQQHESH